MDILIEFTKLLGVHLKDDLIVDILESYDMEVIYDFDRLHENNSDVYWARANEAGFLLRFDEKQVLATIFLYLVPREGYAPVQRENFDVTVHETFDEAEQEFKENAIPYEVSSGEPTRASRILGFSSMHKLWIKGDRGRYTVHYQFENGRVSMITLQSKP